MSSQNPSYNPTGYMGTNFTDPGQNYFERRDPLSTDIHYPVGARWINTASNTFWVLGSVVNKVATWIVCGGSTLAVQELLMDDANLVSPVAGVIALTGDATQGISTSMPVGGTAEITVADSAAAQKGVVKTNSVIHGVLLGGATQELINSTTAGTSGQILQSKGAATDPTWTTATYPATTTAGEVLWSSAANVVATSPSITISSTGVISTPNQSGASYYLNGDLANQTGDGTDVILLVDTKDYDIQSEYTIATGFFEALKTGIYLVTFNFLLYNIGAAHTEGTLRIKKTPVPPGAAVTWWKSQFNPAASKDANDTLSFVGSSTIACVAGEKLQFFLNVYNGTKTVGISAGGSKASSTFQISKIA